MAKATLSYNERVLRMRDDGKPLRKGLLKMPATKQDQNILVDDFISWCNLPDSIFPEEFALSKGINPYHFKHAGDNNPYFKEAYEMGAMICSRRLAKMGLQRKVDPNTMMQLLPVYHKEYKEYKDSVVKNAIEARAAIQMASEPTQRIVLIEKFPDSPLVPEKDTHE